MRRLLISLVVIVGLLVVADRVALTAAERNVANRIQVEQHLSSRPDVTIRGFPFLTQLVAGDYHDVDVTVHGLHAGSLAVSRLTAHLHGVHVSFGDVIAQHVKRVPIDRADAEVVLTYADLDTFLSGRGIQLSPAGSGAVTVTATVAGVTAHGTARVSVRGDAVELTPTGNLPAVEIPLPGLPFHVRLESVQATTKGLVVRGAAEGLVLRA
jgi:hypothetical protein